MADRRASAGGKKAAPPFPKGVSQPAIRALAGAGYTHLDQLAGAGEADLAKLHGMGPKALRILGEALQEQGKSFRA
jgi:predicted flap endonuclease-1-like 5' DNA nuclease